jgi:hypothetical protein
VSRFTRSLFGAGLGRVFLALGDRIESRSGESIEAVDAQEGRRCDRREPGVPLAH